MSATTATRRPGRFAPVWPATHVALALACTLSATPTAAAEARAAESTATAGAGPAGTASVPAATPERNSWRDARDLADRGQYEAALALLRPLIAADTADFDLRWLEAGITGEAGRHAASVALYERLSAAFPDRADALRADLAKQRLWGGDSRGAVRDFRGWLATHPEDRTSRKRLALALARSDSLRPALALYDSLLADGPEDTELAADRARVLGWLGRHGRAIQAYQAILQREPAHAGAELGIAMNENWAGRHRRATRRLEAMLTRPGADPEAIKTLAFARYWDDNPDGALLALATYREHVPEDGEALKLTNTIAREQRSTLEVGFGRADDSDGLHVATPDVELRWPLALRTTGSLGWRDDLTRDATANTSALRLYAGVQHRFSAAWTAYARGAHSSWDDGLGTRPGGELGIVSRPVDHVRFESLVAREPVVTRLAFQNGISLLQWIAVADWTVWPRWSLHADGRAGFFSDGNRSERTKAELTYDAFSGKRADLSLRLRVDQLNTHLDRDHGYYDPDFHREWGPGVEFGWRADARWRLSGATRAGWQREKGGPAEPYYGANGRVRFTPEPDWILDLELGSSDSNLETAAGYRRTWWHLSVRRTF